jgi:glycosyltransferase 2 family protein
MAGAQSRPLRSSLVAWRWLAAFLILALLLYFLPWKPLRAAITRVPVHAFALVLGGYLLAHTVGILKWRMVVNSAGAQLDLPTSARCYLGGLFGTLFLPSIVGGDVVRLAVGLTKSPRPAAVLAGNLVDRVLDVLAQAGLALLGLVLLPKLDLLPQELQRRAASGLLLLLAVGVVLALGIFALRKPLIGGRSIRFRRRLARLRHAFRMVSRRPHVLLLGWLLGTCIQTAFLLLTAQVALMCGLKLPLAAWLFAWPLAKLAAVLPLTQGGIGVREAALVALLVPFGAPASLVLAAGLVWEGVIITGGLIAGAASFFLQRSDVRSGLAQHT